MEVRILGDYIGAALFLLLCINDRKWHRVRFSIDNYYYLCQQHPQSARMPAASSLLLQEFHSSYEPRMTRRPAPSRQITQRTRESRAGMQGVSEALCCRSSDSLVLSLLILLPCLTPCPGMSLICMVKWLRHEEFIVFSNPHPFYRPGLT